MSEHDEAGPDWAALFDARDLAEVFGTDSELPASNPETNPETTTGR
jgi:hypothetical protein